MYVSVYVRVSVYSSTCVYVCASAGDRMRGAVCEVSVNVLDSMYMLMCVCVRGSERDSKAR